MCKYGFYKKEIRREIIYGRIGRIVMAELHTYHGNCHCGAFRFAVRLPEVRDVYACNCSICVRVRHSVFLFFLRGKRS